MGDSRFEELCFLRRVVFWQTVEFLLQSNRLISIIFVYARCDFAMVANRSDVRDIKFITVKLLCAI